VIRILIELSWPSPRAHDIRRDSGWAILGADANVFLSRLILSRRLLITAAAAIAFALVAIVVVTPGRVDRTARPAVLEVEMQASAGAAAQLFWSDDTPVFDEARSMRVPFQPGLTVGQRLRFILPARDIRWLRFDPSDAQSEILIGEMTLFNADGARLGRFDPGTLQPLHDIVSIGRSGRFMRIVSSGADPYLVAHPGCLFPASPRERLSLVSPLSVVVVSVLVLALIGACAISIGRSAFEPRENLAAGPFADSRRTAAIWITTLFIGVFAARLLVMNQFPLTVPYQDQWDAEARVVFLPLEACRLSWGQMFSLHNEHRVFFTRLLSLDLLWLDGQWDPRLQQVANALMHSLTAALMILMLWTRSGRRRVVVLSALTAVTFGLPFAWENVLQGFQSAFYFLELFSLLALWMTTAYRVGSGRWYLGWLCAVCGLFTAAGGTLIPLAIAVAAVVQHRVERAPLRQLLHTLVLSVVVLAIGLAAQSPALAHHAALRAQSVQDFAGTLSRSLAWPWIDYRAVSLLMWLPVIVVAFRAVVHRSADAADPFLLGVASWVALQAAAIAYGRGAQGLAPASRYQDVLSVGLVVNTYFIVVHRDRMKDAMAGRMLSGVLAAWVLVAAVGIDSRVRAAVADLRGMRLLWSAQETNLRRFVITGDVAELSTHPVDQLAYPDAINLANIASHSGIQRILPARVRAPLHVEPRLITDGAFVVDGVNSATPRDPLWPSWGSLSPRGPLGEGRFESSAVSACDVGGRLEFQVTGFLGFPGQHLRLRREDTREIEIKPRGIAGSAWMTVTTPCPVGPYEIVGVDAGPWWFGFRAPTEIGTASAVAESLIDTSPRLFLLAFALALLAARWT
jgi:hypothetical protein